MSLVNAYHNNSIVPYSQTPANLRGIGISGDGVLCAAFQQPDSSNLGLFVDVSGQQRTVSIPGTERVSSYVEICLSSQVPCIENEGRVGIAGEREISYLPNYQLPTKWGSTDISTNPFGLLTIASPRRLTVVDVETQQELQTVSQTSAQHTNRCFLWSANDCVTMQSRTGGLNNRLQRYDLRAPLSEPVRVWSVDDGFTGRDRRDFYSAALLNTGSTSVLALRDPKNEGTTIFDLDQWKEYEKKIPIPHVGNTSLYRGYSVRVHSDKSRTLVHSLRGIWQEWEQTSLKNGWPLPPQLTRHDEANMILVGNVYSSRFQATHMWACNNASKRGSISVANEQIAFQEGSNTVRVQEISLDQQPPQTYLTD